MSVYTLGTAICYTVYIESIQGLVLPEMVVYSFNDNTYACKHIRFSQRPLGIPHVPGICDGSYVL